MKDVGLFIGLMIALALCIYAIWWFRKQEKQDWAMRMMEKKMDYSYDIMKEQTDKPMKKVYEEHDNMIGKQSQRVLEDENR